MRPNLGGGRWIQAELVVRAADAVAAVAVARALSGATAAATAVMQAAPITGDTALHLAALNGTRNAPHPPVALPALLLS